MEARASLKYARIGTQKARLVADVIRGKNINEALRMLSFMKRKPAPLFQKLLQSAVANAEEKQVMDPDNLFVEVITVDQGPYLKRFKPAPQGRAQPIRKKMSHLYVMLSEKRVQKTQKRQVSKKSNEAKTESEAKKATAKKKTVTNKKGEHGSKS